METAQAVKKLIACSVHPNITHIVCPPHPLLTLCTGQKGIQVGAQCVDGSDTVVTGATTAGMLKACGVSYCIVGHAEQRKGGVSDTDIQKKIIDLKKYTIIPILCIGEKDTKKRSRTLSAQLRVLQALSGTIIVAYEPVYAIGAKNPAEIRDIRAAVEYIQTYIKTKAPSLRATVLYGGSVNARTVKPILKECEVDGFLIGRASADARSAQALFDAVWAGR